MVLGAFLIKRVKVIYAKYIKQGRFLEDAARVLERIQAACG